MATDVSTLEVDRLLKEGQAAARNGDMPAARTLLTQVVERDPHNERAWMWLSGVVLEPEEQQICLENVLVINPHNTKARKGLEYLSAKTGISPNVSVPPSGPEALTPGYTETEPLSSDFSRFGDVLTPADAVPAPVTQADSTLVWMQPGSDPIAPEMSPFGAPVEWPQSDMSRLAEVATSSELDQYIVTPDAPSQPVQAEVFQSDPVEDIQPFSLDAALLSPQEPVQYAYDQSLPIPADSGLPPWSIDPRVPAYDGSSILQLDETSPQPDISVDHQLEGSASYNNPVASPGAVPGAGAAPVGPLSGGELPAPTELPGFVGALGDPSQPWYLQSQGELTPTPRVESTNPSLHAAEQPRSEGAVQTSEHEQPSVVTIQCPNCKESTPDTFMACPNCHFSFFVNCPHCHELVDVSEAKSGVKSPCPYCKAEVSMMDMGLSGVKGEPMYQSTPLKGGMVSGPAMRSFRVATAGQRTVTFGWLVNVVWLVVIVASIWALTQLPAWLHLTGQY